jgi:hypothetical protein
MIAKGLPHVPYAKRTPFDGNRPAPNLFMEPAWESVSPATRRLIDKCMQENPRERPLSAVLVELIRTLGDSNAITYTVQ